MDFLKRLEKLMTRLRSPGGCPWDRRQTHKSLKPYLLEEAHETLEAIDIGNPVHLREELGDLLLQVVFHAQLAKEKGNFNLQDVPKTFGDKLIRRHPHVFGKSSRKISDIKQKWEELKRREKPERQSALDGLPQSLPALLRAQRMHEKIQKGLKPSQPKQLARDLEKSFKTFLESLKSANKRDREKSAGEFLLLFARLAQSKSLHAEMALRKAAAIYEKRFRKTETKAKKSFPRTNTD